VPVSISDKDRANFEKRGRIDTLAPEERKELEGWEDPVIKAAAGKG
jgi:hypothetical protein